LENQRQNERKESDAVAVLFVELIGGGSLLPERRSSITAEYEHDRLALVELREMDTVAFIRLGEREI
jgi:hypothetical protein